MPDIKSYQSYLFNADELKSKYRAMIFAAYAVILTILVAYHEPWMDEAQAWLLVKDASLTDIFIKYLRYEGSPGLWHLILAIPANLNLPYFSINVISAVFSALAVWLFLKYSPFPPVVKILFPFSYFILYQYSVVARNYCLVAPLLFLIAIKFKTRIEKPFVFTLLLCVLANVSAHAFLIAGAFFVLYLLDVFKAWKELDKQSKTKQIAAVSMFAITVLLLVLTLAPPSDHFLDSENDFSLTNFLHVSRYAIGGALVLDESSRVMWLQSLASLAVFFITLVWLRRRKLTLWYLFPLIALLALFAVKYRNLWHDGVTFFLWIFALWIGFEKKEAEAVETPFLIKFFPLIIAAVLATQIYWSYYIVTYELRRSYSASRELARYIRENNLENQKIFASGWKAVAVQPYFDKNIFYNHNEGSPHRFWMWNSSNPTPLGAGRGVLALIEKEKPDIVIFASDHLEVSEIKEIKGYHLERLFEGYLFWKTGIHELNAYWLFRKKTPPATNSAVSGDESGRDENLQAETDALLPLFDNMPPVPVYLKDEPVLKSGTNTETGAAYTHCYGNDSPAIFVKKIFYEKANRKQLINALKHEMTHAWLCRKKLMTVGHGAQFREKFAAVGGFGN